MIECMKETQVQNRSVKVKNKKSDSHHMKIRGVDYSQSAISRASPIKAQISVHVKFASTANHEHSCVLNQSYRGVGIITRSSYSTSHFSLSRLLSIAPFSLTFVSFLTQFSPPTAIFYYFLYSTNNIIHNREYSSEIALYFISFFLINL